MEPEDSVTRSQDTTIFPYPKPEQYSPHHPIPLL
jgi:hypothetical protein